MTNRFFRNRRYIGIKYKKSTIHVSESEARASGIKQVWTRTGKPLSIHDADKWVELSDDNQKAAEVFLLYAKGFEFRQTHRVIPCTNPVEALSAGYHLITYEK